MLDRKTLEKFAERKILLNKRCDLFEIPDDKEGKRIDHWMEGNVTGKYNELSITLELLGVYDEVLKIQFAMEAGDYWTQEEIDKAHEEALDYWHEKLSEEWDEYCAGGGRLDFEDFCEGR
jgi:hypothetical protein